MAPFNAMLQRLLLLWLWLAATASFAAGDLPASADGRFSLAPMLDQVVPGVANISTTAKVNIEQPAWLAGLREGDIITSVDRRPVRNMEEFRAVMQAAQGVLLLNIRRGDSALFIAIE